MLDMFQRPRVFLNYNLFLLIEKKKFQWFYIYNVNEF